MTAFDQQAELTALRGVRAASDPNRNFFSTYLTPYVSVLSSTFTLKLGMAF